MSNNSKIGSNLMHKRLKHLKGSRLQSVGKMKKAQRAGLNPMSAMQQIHLLIQEKGFLNRQIEIFETKIEEVKQKRDELDRKITASQTLLAQSSASHAAFVGKGTVIETRVATKPKKTTKPTGNTNGTMTLDY